MQQFSFYLFLAFLISCASTQKQAIEWKDGTTVEVAKSTKKWSKKLKGKVTELASSQNGETNVVTLIRDKASYLTLITGSGKVRWERKLDHSVEKMEFSKKSEWILVSLSNGQIKSFDLSGKLEWEKQENCYPKIIESRGWLICASFLEGRESKKVKILARNGNEVNAHEFKKPIVDYAVSEDEQSLLVGTERGVLWYYHVSQLEKSGARSFRKSSVNGEIMSVSIGNGLDPKAGVLFMPTKDVNFRGQRFALLHGKRKQEFLLKKHADGFHMKPDGSSVIFYGNGPQGQSLSYYSKNRAIDIAPNDYQERWDVHRNHFADYFPSAVQVEDFIVLGLEDNDQKPVPYLLTLNNRGNVVGALEIETSFGAYLYHAVRTSPKKLSFVVATDDGHLHSYELPVSEKI